MAKNMVLVGIVDSLMTFPTLQTVFDDSVELCEIDVCVLSSMETHEGILEVIGEGYRRGLGIQIR